MKLDTIIFSGLVTFTLCGNYMEKDGPMRIIACLGQGTLKVGYVVAIDRANIFESQ